MLTQDAAGFAAAALGALGAQLCPGIGAELTQQRLTHGSGVGFLQLSLESQGVPAGVLSTEGHTAGRQTASEHPKPAKGTGRRGGGGRGSLEQCWRSPQHRGERNYCLKPLRALRAPDAHAELFTSAPFLGQRDRISCIPVTCEQPNPTSTTRSREQSQGWDAHSSPRSSTSLPSEQPFSPSIPPKSPR